MCTKNEMTVRERFRALLAGKEFDRLPVIEWAPWWHETVNAWKSAGLPEESSGTYQLQRYFGLDGCIQTGIISPRTKMTPRSPGFGLGIMENEEDYEKIIRPTLFPDPEKVIGSGRAEFLRTTAAQGDTLNFLSIEGPFWYPRAMFGIENHFYSFYDYPDLYKRMCDEYAEWLKKFLEYAFNEFEFDFMNFAEDMSFNGGPMCSREVFDEFLAPIYKKLVPLIHSCGIPVYIDSDGDITQAVDWYAGIGADGMFPLERKAGVDVSVYLDKQPQMSFIGHFDKMCMKFGEKAMREEFERILPSMIRGKVIPSVDHQTPPDVTMENYRVYVSLLKEYAGKVTHAGQSITPCPLFSSK